MIDKIYVKRQLYRTTGKEDELIERWEKWGWNESQIIQAILKRRDDLELSWQKETFNNLYTGHKYIINKEGEEA